MKSTTSGMSPTWEPRRLKPWLTVFWWLMVTTKHLHLNEKKKKTLSQNLSKNGGKNLSGTCARTCVTVQEFFSLIYPRCKCQKCKRRKRTKKVTSKVPATKPAVAKNPGRVAAGKRLPERNHLACEAKKKKTSYRCNTANSTTSLWNMSSIYLLSIGGFIIFLLSLYYKRKEVMAVIGCQNDQRERHNHHQLQQDNSHNN